MIRRQRRAPRRVPPPPPMKGKKRKPAGGTEEPPLGADMEGLSKAEKKKMRKLLKTQNKEEANEKVD